MFAEADHMEDSEGSAIFHDATHHDSAGFDITEAMFHDSLFDGRGNNKYRREVPSLSLHPEVESVSETSERDEELSVSRNSHTRRRQRTQSDFPSPDDTPASLEGMLYCRKGRAGAARSSFWWKRRYVVLNLLDGGSMSCYRLASDDSRDYVSSSFVSRRNVSKLHRRASKCGDDFNRDDKNSDERVLTLQLPTSLSWHVKDVENDSSVFVIEIETDKYSRRGNMVDFSEASLRGTNSGNTSDNDCSISQQGAPTSSGSYSNLDLASDSHDDNLSSDEDDDDENEFFERDIERGLRRDMMNARLRGKPLRYYFRCPKSGNEKVLWLKAFGLIDRLSHISRKKKTLLGSIKAPLVLTSSRTRSTSSAAFAREGKQLETVQDSINVHIMNDDALPGRSKKKEKEHRVLPAYAYPHRWMTKSEMREEMMKPSVTFHDLRNPHCNLDEIGTLQVEVLQCLGLPKLDRTSETDAVVYMVCGSYAFSTDVIINRANPMWLPRTQRACIIPLHHAYARLFVGVFDDESSSKDDFNGRVVLDVARLRPGCTYDVTLPLRLSAHVYSRRKRGAIRLRFRLDWVSQRAALLSYLPKKIKIKQPKDSKPRMDMTVLCGDQRAFRNAAITVHGAHLPGRFSFQQLRATLREINFTRKSIMILGRRIIRDLREWTNPAMSGFIFFAWMHCVYANSFALVPAYAMFYFMLHLMQNYAKYAIDGPANRGFIPPSWEEMFMALVQDPESGLPTPIEPLSMGYRKEAVEDSHIFQHYVTTHQHWGKWLLRLLGFLEQEKRDNLIVHGGTNHFPNHLEFPYARGTEYPKFGVKECLVGRKTSSMMRPISTGQLGKNQTNSEGKRVIPRIKPGIMRKDASGMNDYDDEEQNFATGKFIRQTGATQLRGAATGLIDVGGSLTQVTGLQFMVSPIKGGLGYVAPPIKSGITHGLDKVVPPLASGITSGIKMGAHLAVTPITHTVHAVSHLRRSNTESAMEQAAAEAAALVAAEVTDENTTAIEEACENAAGENTNAAATRIDSATYGSFDSYADAVDGTGNIALEPGSPVIDNSIDNLPKRDRVPQQNIDDNGDTGANGQRKSSRKRLTDDLQEIKEKMHEMTYHCFNDKLYVVSEDSCYFGQGQLRPDKRRKVEVTARLDKLLQVGQYSHSNPVVARVGQYVEPLVGSAHSFLCAFRALFNILTWRDPFLTFWVSLFGAALVVVLFIFPWRLFLFVVGLWFVGPQNLVIRLLRKHKLMKPKKSRKKQEPPLEEPNELPEDYQVFRGHISQDQKRKPHKPVNPMEVQRVGVPYSPLMYQRFYDWPPEQEYAQVRSENSVVGRDINVPTHSSSFDSYMREHNSVSNAYFTSTIKKNQ